jgi:hypothetical protein
MSSRWRGRFAGLAILATVAICVVLTLPLAASAGAGWADPTLVIRGPDGTVLERIGLPDGEFSLRYRNSLYRSMADEHYAVDDNGQIELVGLGADELAVLEEYYAIDEPAQRSSSGAPWRASPARVVVLDDLLVAATDLGQRAVIVDGREPIELWRLVEDASPSVRLEVERP